MTMTIEFDRPGISGYRLVDFFEGVHWLEDGDTFVGRVNASFANYDLAFDWLRKSYRGRHTDGVGVVVDGEVL